jgi:hypothetical protein
MKVEAQTCHWQTKIKVMEAKSKPLKISETKCKPMIANPKVQA